MASSGGVDISLLADAIWDESLTGHDVEGSAGKKLRDGSSGGPSTQNPTLTVGILNIPI